MENVASAIDECKAAIELTKEQIQRLTEEANKNLKDRTGLERHVRSLQDQLIRLLEAKS